MRHGYIGIFLVASVLIAAGASRAGQYASSARSELGQGFGLHLAKSQPTPRTVKVEFNGKIYHLDRRTVVSAKDIAKAALGKDRRSGNPAINITLNNAGAKQMLAFTRKHLGQTLCATFNDKAITCATIYGVFGAHFQVIFHDRLWAQRVYESLTARDDGRRRL